MPLTLSKQKNLKTVFLFSILLTSCTSYEGTVVVKGCCPSYLECKMSDNWFIIPANALEAFDSVKIDDTVRIDRRTLKIEL